MDNIRSRWKALYVLCAGALMIVLDTTIVNVALPSIKSDLGFNDVSLAWVINAYMLTYGGLLLLGGRLGDLYGKRRLYIIGISIFTIASLSCALAGSQWMLITSRAVQGIGGAIASAVALSLMMNLFTEPGERAQAMGIFGFVAAGGGSVGVLLGGVLTSVDWHWIFLINIPVGIAVALFSRRLLSETQGIAHRHLDLWGALTITGALTCAVYAVINGSIQGWGSGIILALSFAALALFAAFIAIESNISAPLIPLRLFTRRNIITANAAGILWSAAMFAWFFLTALYMQLVLQYPPLLVGLAFLPANVVMALFSIGLSARIVMRFGIRGPLFVGLALASAGLALLSRLSVDADFWTDIFPSMILLGVGAGIAFNPILLAAMSDVSSDESGLASGVANTSFMMGGALGLAVLASIAASQTTILMSSGSDQASALVGGYNSAFLFAAICALIAAVIGGVFIRVRATAPSPETVPVH